MLIRLEKKQCITTLQRFRDVLSLLLHTGPLFSSLRLQSSRNDDGAMLASFVSGPAQATTMSYFHVRYYFNKLTCQILRWYYHPTDAPIGCTTHGPYCSGDCPAFSLPSFPPFFPTFMSCTTHRVQFADECRWCIWNASCHPECSHSKILPYLTNNPGSI